MAIIKENGTIVQLGEVRQGTSAKGFNWSRQQGMRIVGMRMLKQTYHFSNMGGNSLP